MGYYENVGVNAFVICNLLRHTKGTLMHKNGAEIRYLQKLLGISSIPTIQVYTHVSPIKLKKCTSKRTHTLGGATP